MDLFFLKLLDCILSTLKSIYLYKNKNFISALFNTIATGFYMLMIVKLSKSDSPIGILLICLATFLGSYIPAKFIDKTEKDKVFIFDVFPCDNQSGKDFADTIRSSNLAIVTYKGYSDNKELVLCSKVYSQSKEHSKLIESLIPNTFKYHVVEVKNSKII